MVVGEMPESRDLVILGVGPGGLAAARAGVDAGRAVTLVADGEPGGAMAQWRPSSTPEVAEIQALGVEMVRGEAVFAGPRQVRVLRADAPSAMLEFESCVIATGAEWVVPEPPGPAGRDDRVRVEGRGTPALATIARLLREGAVPVVTAAQHIAPELHTAVALDVVRMLVRRGLEVGQDEVGTTISAARRPRTARLAADRAGLSLLGDGSIAVAASLIAGERIAAVGDVISGDRTPQRAAAQARVAVAALAGDRVEWGRLVPVTVDLDLGDGRRLFAGSVGDHSPDAGVLVGRMRSCLSRLTYDPGSRILIGASAVGDDAVGFVAGITPVVEAGLTVDDVVESVLPLAGDLIERPWTAEEERT